MNNNRNVYLKKYSLMIFSFLFLINTILPLPADSALPEVSGTTSSIKMSLHDEVSITWVLYDQNPDCYKVFKNNSLILENIWENGEIVTVSLQDLTIGNWTFAIHLNDTWNNNYGLSIWVSVFKYYVAPVEDNNTFGNTLKPEYILIALFTIITLGIMNRRKNK